MKRTRPHAPPTPFFGLAHARPVYIVIRTPEAIVYPFAHRNSVTVTPDSALESITYRNTPP